MPMSEQWRDIPGYDGRYQINERGQVRSLYCGSWKRGTPRLMHPIRNEYGWWVVDLRAADGTKKKHYMQRLMAMTYLNMPEDYVAFPKNGVKSDWALENIGMKRKKLRGYGTASRRPVRKVRKCDGEDVAYYGTVKAAAAANYMSPRSVSHRCNGRICIESEEYTFQYDDKG